MASPYLNVFFCLNTNTGTAGKSLRYWGMVVCRVEVRSAEAVSDCGGVRGLERAARVLEVPHQRPWELGA